MLRLLPNPQVRSGSRGGRRLLALCLLLVGAGVGVGGRATPVAQGVTVARAAQLRGADVAQTLGQVRFLANRGQAPSPVRFLVPGRRVTWSFTPTGAAVRLNGAHPAELHLRPRGAQPGSALSGEDRMPAQVNYLVGSDPHRWVTGIPAYAAIRYHDVYPGIDLRFHGRGSTMEYDWLVRPGGEPSRIGLVITGATSLRLAADGSVTMRTAAGSIRQEAPFIYQMVGGRRQRIAGKYLLAGRDTIRLMVGRYDRTRPLIIDPKISYLKVLSGGLDDGALGIAVDSAGNTYIAGWTESDNFPVRAALQPQLSGAADIVVAKLDPAGNVVYSTYLGGNRGDYAYGIAVDSSGSAYVAGVTNSTNFPTTAGALQVHLGGGTCPRSGGSFACEDAFVSKLNAAGNGLVYSTYLGGNLEDYARGIAVDSAGDAVVAGETYSSNFPTVHAVQPKFRAEKCGRFDVVFPCPDAFVAKLNSSGTGLLFSTYLGGRDFDLAFGVALDPQGEIEVTGETRSPDWPTIHGLHHSVHGHCRYHEGSFGRCPHAFVATLSSSGATLVFSSVLGGSAVDIGRAVAADSQGNVYVAGETASRDFPLVKPVQRLHFKQKCPIEGVKFFCDDAFITKIDPHTSTILYSSHIGGTAEDVATTVSVDGNGDAYLAGFAGSYNFPILNAVQKRNSSGYDVFAAELTPAGNRAYYSTYLGGEHDDYAYGVAVRSAGDAYVAGQTTSPQFPKKIKYGPVPHGLDAFVFRLETGAARPAGLPCLLLFGQKGTGC
jgi:hypothetical protein